MDFRGPERSFEEADRRYAELKRLHEAGEITEEEFDEHLKRSMVQDEGGRWWSKSRKSGEWHYNDGNAWVPGTPPDRQQSISGHKRGRPDVQHDYAPEPTVRSTEARAKVWLAMGLLTALAVVVVVLANVLAGYMNTSSEKASSEKASPTTDTVVPDLRGKIVSEAAQMVGTDYVLEVGTVWGKDLTDPDNEPKGTIVSQVPYPSHGERETPRGSVITVILSGGQDDVVVPEVTGLSVLQAAKILLDAGLDPSAFNVRFDQNGTPVAATNPGDKEDVSQRTVTEATLAGSSLPAAGSKTEPGDLVFLSYS